MKRNSFIFVSILLPSLSCTTISQRYLQNKTGIKTKITKKKSRIKIKNVHHQVMRVLTEGKKLSTVIKTLLACFFHSPSRVLMLLIQLRMISIVKKHDNCHTLDCTFIYYFFSSFYIQ
jgi:hypothetical protein